MAAVTPDDERAVHALLVAYATAADTRDEALLARRRAYVSVA